MSAPDASAGSVDARSNQSVDAQLPDVVDAAPPTPDAAPCYGETLTVAFSNLAPCDIPEPTGSLTLDDDQIWILDTDDGSLVSEGSAPRTVTSALVGQAGGGPMVRVVSVTDMLVGDSFGVTVLAVVGPHPAVFVASGDITIDGFVYAGGDASEAGPGGNASACGASTGSGGSTIAGAGSGGGGGGFGSPGGSGATSSSDDSGVDNPVAGGASSGNNTITPLRGGCGGGAGGNGGGPGGGGGGAVQFIVEGTLAVSGGVVAPGGGGLPPQPEDDQPSQAAGGGGGSGGALLLEANTLSVTGFARILANGGGGGEGTRSGGEQYGGERGENGHFADDERARGGEGGGAGGDGGDGAVGNSDATDGAVGTSGPGGDAGGGGGGGGTGRIRINSPAANIGGQAIVSPAPG